MEASTMVRLDQIQTRIRVQIRLTRNALEPIALKWPRSKVKTQNRKNRTIRATRHRTQAFKPHHQSYTLIRMINPKKQKTFLVRNQSYLAPLISYVRLHQLIVESVPVQNNCLQPKIVFLFLLGRFSRIRSKSSLQLSIYMRPVVVHI